MVSKKVTMQIELDQLYDSADRHNAKIQIRSALMQWLSDKNGGYIVETIGMLAYPNNREGIINISFTIPTVITDAEIMLFTKTVKQYSQQESVYLSIIGENSYFE